MCIISISISISDSIGFTRIIMIISSSSSSSIIIMISSSGSSSSSSMTSIITFISMVAIMNSITAYVVQLLAITYYCLALRLEARVLAQDLRGSSVLLPFGDHPSKLEKISMPLRKDDTHRSRSVNKGSSVCLLLCVRA